ncbi:NAB1 [Branchiostoma lanceolatum]|uniref:NAB1 protein n=1 Tax=Branchiostoma lanceolatum TaxID=7740 RepID=A0A8J9YV22_BRALA|nr:NAB1 [Branchiostoma lanceolatum]
MDGNSVTMATIPNHKPANLGELQLYRVLQRGNLLQYFDVFISQGGDDVQQLCEAGEEEFLEIMSLVGMASKPLHVRRLQKSLQEWVTTPALFQDVIPTSPHQIPIPPGVSLGLANQQAQQVSPMSPSWSQSSVRDGALGMQSSPPSPGNNSLSLPPTSTTPPHCSMSPSSVGRSSNSSPVLNMYESTILEPNTAAAIKEVAYAIVLTTRKDGEELPKSLPKKLEKQLRNVIEMSEEDSMLEEEVRKWSAIYGRFDSKRKSEKLLTLHEIMVNEAAFALCMYDRMLLCRREELFPLARQVVRESGYKFKHGKSRASSSASKDVECYSRAKEVSRQADMTGTSQPPCKRVKVEQEASNVKPDNSEHTRTVQAELSKIKRQERMTEISETLKDKRDKLEVCKERIQNAKDSDNYPCVADLQMELEQLTNEQLALMTEQADLIRQQKRSDKYYRTKARMAEQNGDEECNDITIKQEPPDEEDICVTGADSSLMPSSGSSPTRDVPEVTLTHTRTPRKSALPTKRLVQETLMEEGLRLAQEHLQSEEMTSNGRANCEQEEKDHTTAHEGPTLRKLIKQET